MPKFYKAVRMDGLSFRASPNGLRPRFLVGDIVTMPQSRRIRREPRLCTDELIHAAKRPEDTMLTSCWPLRLFIVQGRPIVSSETKSGFYKLRSIKEVEAYLVFGPNGKAVAEFLRRVKDLKSIEKLSKICRDYKLLQYRERERILELCRGTRLKSRHLLGPRRALLEYLTRHDQSIGKLWPAAMAVLCAKFLKKKDREYLYSYVEPHIPWKSLYEDK